MSDPTPAELEAARWRIIAARHRLQAAMADANAAAVLGAASLQRLVVAAQAAYDSEVAAHPDLAELDVRLDGFYGDPT